MLLAVRTDHDVLGVVCAIYLLAVIGTTGTEAHATGGGGERHVLERYTERRFVHWLVLHPP